MPGAKGRLRMDYPLDQGPLDEQMIRRWAYDSDAELMQQDEDLLLHDWVFAEILFELIADPECPKADYILGIWDHFTRHHTAHQMPSDISAAREAMQVAEAYRGHVGIRRWMQDQALRLDYVAGVGRVDREAALAMGEALLNGAARSCPISILSETGAAFIVQLSVPHGTHREWLLIDKATGRFRYSRYWPSGAGEPRWFDPNR